MKVRRALTALAALVGASVAAGLGMATVGAQQGQGQPQQVFCHVPPGNPGNGQTISLPPPAVEAHLREHPFDHTGPCTGAEPTPATASELGPLFFGEGGFLISEGVFPVVLPGTRFVDASGGDGGSVRGGDGGRGGDGVGGICNQNNNDVEWLEWWEEDGDFVSDEPTVNCGSGGRGGEGGDAGVSEGGDGGIAFDAGGFSAPSTPIFTTGGFA